MTVGFIVQQGSQAVSPCLFGFAVVSLTTPTCCAYNNEAKTRLDLVENRLKLQVPCSESRNTVMGPPMGFRGTRDKTFFVCGIRDWL